MDMNVHIDGDSYYKILTQSHIKQDVKSIVPHWGNICFELDEEMGLELIGEDVHVYSFKVIDERKWLLAKVKYGL
jgi:hypothetical protein